MALDFDPAPLNAAATSSTGLFTHLQHTDAHAEDGEIKPQAPNMGRLFIRQENSGRHSATLVNICAKKSCD